MIFYFPGTSGYYWLNGLVSAMKFITSVAVLFQAELTMSCAFPSRVISLA
jgi:hypothetical protein